MYDNLKKLINGDEVLKEVQSEIKCDHVEHHSKAVKKIEELVSDQVDLSSIILPDVSIIFQV